jgi:DNA helicase-2/ATP-dependent DNA helicase PcrA
MTLSQDIKKLNQQQSDIIKKFNRPSLIVAGPGTGKTRTVAVLIGDLLNKGLRLKQILALTFSDKAANELKQRVLEYYPESFDECWISTFHSFCARILREQYHRIFIKPDFKLLTGFKEALLMSEICRNQDPDGFDKFGAVLNKRGFQQEILTFISLLKSNLVSHEDFSAIINKTNSFGKRVSKRLTEIAALYRLYEQEREKAGYLDFRDLISLSVKVLQIPEVAQYYQNKFEVILVDEFQDTDPAQYLLLSLLKQPDKKSRIAVIGDPKQSIYRFRGADPTMMTYNGEFRKSFKAKVFPLQLNYRSRDTIIKKAVMLDWKEKSELDKKLSAANSEPGFIQLFKAADDIEEARFLTRKIAALIIYGEKRKYRPDEVAILVRNNYQIDLLAENLQALHIPFDIAGDMKFFKSEEVIVLASLLKASSLSGIDREEAIKRAFASPVFELEPLWVQSVLTGPGQGGNINSVLENISEQNFSNLPETTEEQQIKAGFFAETVKMLENCNDLPLTAVFARLLLAMKSILKDPDSVPARNALHFRNMIADYSELFLRQNDREAKVKDLIPELDEWLTYYASTLEQEQSKKSSAGVKIMTVHQSKGLEFPVVAIPGLCEGQFPVNLRENLLVNTSSIEKLKQEFDRQNRQTNFFNPYPLNHEDHLEEERRLFFVAITRAEEGLILSYPMKQGTDPAMPAPYLKELQLKALDVNTDNRPLNLSEFRTCLSDLSEEELQTLKPEIEVFDNLIDKSFSAHGIRPRTFKKAAIDEVHLPEDFVFSASSIKNYIDCPRRFYFLNILKIRNPLLEQQSWFKTGNAFHKLLEELHRPGSIWEKGKLPEEGELETLFNEHCLPILNELDFFKRHQEIESIKQTLPDYLTAVYNNYQLPPRETIGVEKSFNFTFSGFKFRGRFDRLIQQDDTALVVDYKTSKSAAANSEKAFEKAFPDSGNPIEIQLPLYLMACQAMGFKKASAILLYVRQGLYKRKFKQMSAGFLRSAALNFGCGPEYGIEISETDFGRFTDKILQILNEIKTDKCFLCRPSNDSDAMSCLNFDRDRKPRCEFYTFCQENLEKQNEQK